MEEATRRHADYIAGETLALALNVGLEAPAADLVQELDVGGHRARLAARRTG